MRVGSAKVVLLILTLGVVAAGCEASEVDGTDLRGVFAASSSSGAAGGRRAAPVGERPADHRIVSRARPIPVQESCLAPRGKPAEPSTRVAKRPTCHGARVLEFRDPVDVPRYGCVYEPGPAADEGLPLVVFLHDVFDDPSAIYRKTRLRRWFRKFDLSGDPERPGFAILAVQARRIGAHLRWDTAYHGPEHPDVDAIGRFVDRLVEEGVADPSRIYVLGAGRGGEMANLFAFARPDRVAAFGTFAAAPSEVQWSCDGNEPPPVAVLYRACDGTTACSTVERWLERRRDGNEPTFALRLGQGSQEEPSCALSRRACGPKRGAANHQRWPKRREKDVLRYLGRFRLEGAAFRHARARAVGRVR
ncbi:MAG: hypothetical protein AAGA56_15455 [Myxococcota bacterium]